MNFSFTGKNYFASTPARYAKTIAAITITTMLPWMMLLFMGLYLGAALWDLFDFAIFKNN